MKPILYVGLAASLALGACASTYKTAQTPDDVYYSPRQQTRTYASASNNGSNGNTRQDENANYVEAADEGGTYVTYQDEDQGDYQRRINRFGDNANSYAGGYWDGYNAASNMYFNNSFYYGGGLGLGFGYSPYSSFYPYSSFSMGFGWGSGFYRPWNSFYGGFGYPYIGSYWPGYYSYYPGYYNPYYGGGYYGGGYYHGVGGSYRAASYGPVRSSNERIITRSNNYVPANGGANNGYVRPSRGGVTAPNNGGRYTPSTSERPRRIFQQSSNERPVVNRPTYNNSNNRSSNNNTYSRPQRVEYSRPSAPSVPASRPSYTPSSSGGSGGGGGYSRPVRGGR